MFAALLAHQPYCTLPDFRRKLGLFLVHSTILSNVGASTKTGVVHGPKFIVLSLGGRYAVCAFSILLPALALTFSIGRLAQYRFFSAQDIDGSGLTRGTSMAVLLQAMLQNTLEQSLLALFAYSSWCLLVPSQLLPAAPTAAVLFLVGRVLFFNAYDQGAKARALGFALTFYPTVLLLIGSAYFALTAVLAMINPG